MGRLQPAENSLLNGKKPLYVWTQESTRHDYQGWLFYNLDFDGEAHAEFKYGNGGYSYTRVPLEACRIEAVDPVEHIRVQGVDLKLHDAAFSAYNRRFAFRYPEPLNVSTDSWTAAMESQGDKLENGNKGILLYGVQYFVEDKEWIVVDNKFLQNHPQLYERVMFIDTSCTASPTIEE